MGKISHRKLEKAPHRRITFKQEEQLTEFEEQNFTKQLHNEYWTGGSSAIIIIIIIIMIYFGKNPILKCLKNRKRTPRKEEAPRELQ